MQRCLVTPLPSQADLAALAQLLSAVLSHTAGPSAVQALLYALQDLIKALPSSSSSMTAKAQQAVSAVVASLRTPQPTAESISSAQSVSSDAVEQAASLSEEIDALQPSISNASSTRSAMFNHSRSNNVAVQLGSLCSEWTCYCAQLLPFHC